MPLSDARKRANKKWNDSHTKIFSARLRNEEFAQIEDIRSDRGMSRADVLRDWLKSHSDTPNR